MSLDKIQSDFNFLLLCHKLARDGTLPASWARYLDNFKKPVDETVIRDADAMAKAAEKRARKLARKHG